MLNKSSVSDKNQAKKYKRADLLAFSSIKTLPSDWRPIELFQKSFAPRPQQAKIHRFKSKVLPKVLKIDDKENELQTKPKQSLENFILKEIENSLHELHKNPIKVDYFSKLNPHAQEFYITNS